VTATSRYQEIPIHPLLVTIILVWLTGFPTISTPDIEGTAWQASCGRLSLTTSYINHLKYTYFIIFTGKLASATSHFKFLPSFLPFQIFPIPVFINIPRTQLK
jgi:hypothetical protein